ncbi:hypothetical protein BGW38_004456 [Lunasporangiospora selenospora]|uniref:START domain-containing protein n=1 Tax=Lunasporangiospora selenospora TaxID=979761 RepID=A0A9P6FQH2_9FUNG|nr:hypothetical protein BGW38_004456 [Lunasporangiospora selenospora]
MVMSNIVSQTTNRHRSLSEPLKPDKFLFAANPGKEEVLQSGSAFLSPIGPIKSDKDIEQLDDKETMGDDDLQRTLSGIDHHPHRRDIRNSLAPSLASSRSLAPSIFSSEFLESNAALGDTAMFGDSDLFGKGGIYESQLRHQEEVVLAAEQSRTINPKSPTLAHNRVKSPVDPASDSDASMTSRVKIVPRVPKLRDSAMSSRPNSMAFAAYGVRPPSAIMEARRHSTLIGRNSTFAPRHSHALPVRNNSNTSQSGLHRSSTPISQLSGSMKRHSNAPSVDSNRSSTLTASTLAVPHRHSETVRKALAMFKVLASSPEDRWRAVSNEGGFKSYSRIISGAGLPMMRGEGIISGGWTVEQINAVIESAGCRQVWDERFENMSIAETFNSNEYLFHITLRDIDGLTGRDLAGVTIIDRDPQTCALYNVSTSVLDPTIPEDPGCVRAVLEMSGWSLRPIFDGQGNTVSVHVTFVIQIDIRGTLPSSVVKSVSSGMMSSVSRLNQFINKTGCPPYPSFISGTRLLDTFEPKTGYFELCYKASPGWTEIRVGRKVYRDGYDFFIKPDDPTVRVELAPDFGGVRVFTTLDHEGQSIIAQVTRKGQSPISSATRQQQQLMQQYQEQHEEDEEDEEKEDESPIQDISPYRARSRDSRMYDPTTTAPTYGGPSLRKSPGALKSNEAKDDTDSRAEQMYIDADDDDVDDAGRGPYLRPLDGTPEDPSSIHRRKRRSASHTTLSASFDPNSFVAVVAPSSSDRSTSLLMTSVPAPNFAPAYATSSFLSVTWPPSPTLSEQASTLAKASQEFERNRSSRSRVPCPLGDNAPVKPRINIVDLCKEDDGSSPVSPSPIFSRRSSSLNRFSTSALTFVPKHEQPAQSFLRIADTQPNTLSPTLSILTTGLSPGKMAITSMTTTTTSTSTCSTPREYYESGSPLASPTLGRFHIPHVSNTRALMAQIQQTPQPLLLVEPESAMVEVVETTEPELVAEVITPVAVDFMLQPPVEIPSPVLAPTLLMTTVEPLEEPSEEEEEEWEKGEDEELNTQKHNEDHYVILATPEDMDPLATPLKTVSADQTKNEDQNREQDQDLKRLETMSSPVCTPIPTRTLESPHTPLDVNAGDILDSSCSSGSGENSPVFDQKVETPLLKHSALKSSLQSSPHATPRKVTFSPDVVEKTAENSNLKRRRRRKSTSSSLATKTMKNKDSLETLQTMAKKSHDDNDTFARVSHEGTKPEGEDEYASDEAEFVEAAEELLPESEPEMTSPTSMTTVWGTSRSKLVIDHVQDREQVWGGAVNGLVGEVYAMQVKIVMSALMLMLMAVYLSSPEQASFLLMTVAKEPTLVVGVN